MKIKLFPVTVFLLVFTSQTQADDCLEAVEHQIESAEPSYNQVWLEWSARIRNSCEESYYTLVTVDFHDAEEKRIHQSLTSTMIKKGDTVTLNKRSLVDEDVYSKIENSEIRIDPEELPNEVQ
ncbi:hypothetical protein [Thiohalophilus sp.]|uniref:hypothetical protein n=1 Tax=Thiohalophilus sp. TaxID=3028392 RepID=UPI003976F2F4